MDAFMSSQAEFNKNINENLKELSKTQLQSRLQQQEINNLHKSLAATSTKVDETNKVVAVVQINQALLLDFKSQVRQLKWSCLALFVTVALAIAKMVTI